MYEVFLSKVNEKVSLTKQEEAEIVAQLTHKTLRKRQFFLKEGDICRYIALVEKGALRTYVTDPEGHEHITAFALEGWSLGDLCSFFREEPATQNIEALEDCDLCLISRPAHEALLQTMPKYETYHRILMTEAYIALQKRTRDMISLSPDEQYKAFVSVYPNIVLRVPQHMIASYLGLTPETLSRIKSRISHQR
ncbi:Crp/Fnr family transcriptional regulator [Chitinophaga sp.]|uniref:Crp/Fnr family transcriptional regulator n=1 Tax=Chitinophaga sp. TaxID=1869181 RepID=UPI0031D52804